MTFKEEIKDIIKNNPAAIGAAAITGLIAVVPVFLSFFTADGNIPFFGLPGGIFSGACAALNLWILSKKLPAIAVYPALAVALLLIAKPKLAPVTYVFPDGLHAFSYTSETHLYFVIPGVILAAAGFLFLLKSREGSPS